MRIARTGALFGNRGAAPTNATGTIAVTQANHTSSMSGSATQASIVVGATSSGADAGGGTTITITFPTNSAGDYLLLVIAGNQTSTAFTVNANGTIDAEVAQVDTRRLTMLKVSPVSGASTCVITASAARVWSWVCLNLGQITPTAYTAGSAIGTNTTSAIAMPTVTGVPSTDGHELQVIAACTNSSATWTAPATPTGQTERRNYGTAPGLYVSTAPCASGNTSFATASMDRANNGTNRNETALVAVLA